MRRRSGPRAAGSFLVVLATGGALAGCAGEGDPPALFERLAPGRTGVAFVNELPESPELNILNYLNYYNGGGVAVGDVDGDGRVDLYFTANLGPNRLYLNRGDFRFEDVTERAGVAGGDGWTTGATMADVNGDGHLDIYVSGVAPLPRPGRNILYLNEGDGTFSDRTEAYGLDHAGYGTQAAFFDYDLDGDLDAYLLNHSTHEERGNTFEPRRGEHHPRAGDRLLRNDGGAFVDVTAEAGIYGTVEGYGLGVVASDLDLDGCPDLFVANDFQENDFLYYNDCDGTFTESLATATGHTSRSSMGVDAADFDDDGRPDLVVLDMLPWREEILKTSANAESFAIEDRKLAAGYHPQYARNTLQLNRGLRRFSEIGYLAGVHATDWSWAPLFADLDDDGRKDLFVTNGIPRRPNDLDYYELVRRPAAQAALADGVDPEDMALVERMPRVPIPNHAFRNEGDLTFSDRAAAWGLAEPGFANGAAYADLDDDGALDLIVNNIGAPASIYRNRGREVTGHHSLTVELRGEGANTAGIGAKVLIRHGEGRQLQEQMPTRGFQSSVDPRLHFGLGAAERVDSLLVIWPDRRYQVLTGLDADRRITLSQAEAEGRWDYGEEPVYLARPGSSVTARSDAAVEGAEPDELDAGPRFVDRTAETGLDFAHTENRFFDENREPLLPHRLSTQGPPLAVGDVNGDGLDDLFVGGAEHQAGRLYLQGPDGTFGAAPAGAFRTDSLAEDVGAAFFDADGDGDLDLYVASGGNEYWGSHEALRDRLYLGDGRGGFRRAPDRLPEAFGQSSCVVPGDFDADGDVDLFVGGRVVAREYGRVPRSHLLENDGAGRFRDVAAERAPGLAQAGLVTSAAWIDPDGDGRLDLVVVGEWMPVRIFRQEEGRFRDRTSEAGLAGTSGWWNRVLAADLTGDGRTDLALGNLGLNSYVRASPEEPARLYVHDFGRDGALEQILTVHRGGDRYPLVGRDELVRAIPGLRDRWPTYADFGAARLEDIFPETELDRATVLEAVRFASSLAVAREDGTYRLESLPAEAQFAPIYAILPADFDGDGRTDLLTAGNFHGVPPLRGRYDASYGLWLRGTDGGRFEAVDMAESGLVVPGETRDLGLVRRADGERMVVVAKNDDPLQILLHRP